MDNQRHQDEVTLKELIVGVKEYALEIVRKWWLVGIVTALCVCFFLYKHYTHVVTYPYEIKFMVEGESSQPALGGLLGQIGIGKQNANPIKIQEVGRSNMMFQKIAFSSSGDRVLSNAIIEEYNLDKKWTETDDQFKDFRFTSQSEVTTMREKIAFKRLAGLVWKGSGNESKPLLSLGYNFDEGIYRIGANSNSKAISKDLANILYDNIANFFENEVLKNKSKALEVLGSRLDSLDLLRQRKNLEIARFDDRSAGIISSTYSSKRNILQQDMLAITNSYAEVLKNRELAEFNLNSSKALFLVVDKTLEPISGIRSRISKNIIYGIALGLFLGSLIVVASRFYRTVMQDS